ncbi:UDP-N-acetylmuramoyl-tripeptide--D-alanyl-D-alanine ligase [Empedobacter falsenii]|uniref:UDP-N-acetylmuramoyl-tripeptide--D-alanyl-D-alanine ligase n=1 Tax=Empedobacter falsenii TaxID=343874 RepID=A0ABY8V9D7_9FLAO|nr:MULTISPECIES: UDP-N-acetylmuramoyl-tripeptide--D-alanyl-D-alanine ligase [Empedobacter]MCA4781842.1 UDP-N-acetylmuramoyl-tripeptide--D-alanyl-D-alanine ligase [Empedobacter stercoris]WIH97737.1 UDP-N-acetylmuramoyl-tripeptide--D-alanyl-D-alanine ligase [Empedobacter falsenii]HJD86109.1 UDP-N-acetylmuramoyl-tripeptide--D-alanyl-D-alanine ligase [Empedobacter falsenii]
MNTAEIFEQFLKSKNVTTDTRNISKDCIFFALKGANFNGNTFAQEAINQGAMLAIVDEKEYENNSQNIFLVHNALETLQDLARMYRKHLQIPFIGLTGSNGKTTTKELISAVLKEKFKTHYTFGNLNNHIGVPLTILSIPEDTEIAVIEMGANHQKEIELLASISQPDFGYITNFGKAHLEGFGGIEGVIKGKSELYDFLRANKKTAFVNYNDPIQVEKTADINRITFSDQNNTDVQIELIENKTEYLAVKYKNLDIHSHLTGNYNFSNISCAIAIGQYFGIDAESIKNGIENYFPSNNRSQIINKENYKIVMDAYNANPSSMEASLNNFVKFEGSKTIIIGDMFELGDEAKTEHQRVLDLAERLNFDQIFILGHHFSETITTNPNVKKFEDRKAFEKYLIDNPIKTKNILIKGSHGMRLDLLENI